MAFNGVVPSTPNLAGVLVKLIRAQVIQSLRAGLPWLPAGVTSYDTYRVGGEDKWAWSSYTDLAIPALTDVEGTTYVLPPGENPPTTEIIESDNIEFTAKEQARMVRVAATVLRQNPHSFATIAGDKIARAAAIMADVTAESIWKAAHPGEVVLFPYPVGGGAAAATNPVDPDVLSEAVAVLRANDVAPLGDGTYVFTGHPFTIADIFKTIGERGYTDYAKYGDTSSLADGVVGKWQGITFVSSSRARKDAAGSTYTSILAGAEAIAFADPGATRIHITLPTASDSDPAANRASFVFVSLLGGAPISTISEQDGTTRVYRHVKVQSTPKFSGTQV